MPDTALAAGAHWTSRPALARATKTAAFGSAGLSTVALIHDLGRPARFLNMLRVFKVTSPMSVGSWLLASFAPLAGVATASAWTGRVPRIGVAATAGTAVLGPGLAAYTAALITDTAVPAWHDGYREMPFVFTGFGAAAAGGLGMLVAPVAQSTPARTFTALGVVSELVATHRMEKRLGMVAEPYSSGRSGKYMRASKVLSVVGVAGAFLGRRRRMPRALSGLILLAASAATRWGVFHAGRASAADPKYTVIPQRERVRPGGGRALRVTVVAAPSYLRLGNLPSMLVRELGGTPIRYRGTSRGVRRTRVIYIGLEALVAALRMCCAVGVGVSRADLGGSIPGSTSHSWACWPSSGTPRWSCRSGQTSPMNRVANRLAELPREFAGGRACGLCGGGRCDRLGALAAAFHRESELCP